MEEAFMAFSKKDEFEANVIWLSDAAKALAHPARINILKILTEMDSCMVGNIVDLLPLSQSTVSQHLLELKKVGFIKGTINGPKVCYCVDQRVLIRFRNEINKLFKKIGCC